MFEKAARQKLRFDSPKGLLSVEDLWDLPLGGRTTVSANLDDIAKRLHRLLKNDDDVSFVVKEKKSDATVQLKFDIVKHVIEVRIAEDEARAARKADSERRQKILAIIADREDENLKSLPLDELRALGGAVKA